MQKNLKSRVTINRLCYKGLDVFTKKGYHNTSLDDILKELELSKGAFYHHFKSKEDYFIYIIQNLVVRKIFSLLIEPLDTHDNPIPVIVETIENALEPDKNNELAYGFLLSDFLAEFNNRNEEINKYLQDILSLWEVNLVSLLKKGKYDGHIARHVDCEGAAAYIIASYLGMRTLLKGSDSKQFVYRYIQQLKSYFNSLKPIAIYA
ncbi:TetR/AcrR family transcriptional regulator [Flagellimonas allohymeniacidonis]|uniref:TetR/AcrR family transcriptional regulator n=1 Tax=Flagellimonas allohymeniacidonis TaxID=2517819 RepID=A0A4Q8QDC5_9FLAO|nr:TetR/AcrR family transcriptional regulator [Allomuricauda hymeniacidonis]TAI47527.1 TetR/AcrR family transcriptional regulator [Allomuricauda hymeniacidonis]